METVVCSMWMQCAYIVCMSIRMYVYVRVCVYICICIYAGNSSCAMTFVASTRIETCYADSIAYTCANASRCMYEKATRRCNHDYKHMRECI
jgi:hypothetical protein